MQHICPARLKWCEAWCAACWLAQR